MAAKKKTEEIAPRSQVHIMSVDVEDFFQVEAFAADIPRASWDRYPLRVEANTRRILDLFDEHEAKATFFVLGWIADRCPQLIREIYRRGHEIACHSYWHRCIYNLTPKEFREDTRLAKEALEQAAGTKIIGYRAPIGPSPPNPSGDYRSWQKKGSSMTRAFILFITTSMEFRVHVRFHTHMFSMATFDCRSSLPLPCEYLE